MRLQYRGPFSIITDDGPIIVLSPDRVEDVNQQPHLSLEALAQDVRSAEACSAVIVAESG